jgi:quinoprotein glucose dehydrogenase
VTTDDSPHAAELAASRDRPSQSPYEFVGYERWKSPDGFPAVKPPWGTLSAIDLNTGEYRWRIPLGSHPELETKGGKQTGTEQYGGPIVTAGGLLFIAATQDNRIRAFDKSTGALLWEAPLPAAGYATPSTYRVNGRQFVVIACGGGKLGSPSGDAYVAFALP